MSLRHTLLGLLDWIPSHGYALREMAKGYAWLYPMSNANVYPTLRRLEEEGFVHHTEEVVEGRLRKVYATTEAGRSELRRWLGDPTPQSGTYRDPTLLKIGMLRDHALKPARAWVERDLEQSRALVDEVERYLTANGELLPKYTRRVAEHGLALARLRCEWLGEILEELSADVARESAESGGV